MQKDFSTEQHKELHKELHREFYLTCEKYYIFELLTVAGGMMGLYTYNLRGGFFCNAQTGNIVKMAAAILSEILPEKVRNTHFIRWDTMLVGIEIIVLFVVGLIPFSWPNQISQVLINFLCAMQFNTFRQAEGIPMATTFVTNHVRQIGISIARIIKHHDQEAEARQKASKHVKLILAFFFGGVFMTLISQSHQEEVIWFAIIPLSICFAFMLRSDLVYEKAMLDIAPHGH